MKSYTDLEQSKELAEILPLEGADMHYVLIDTDEDKYAVGLGKYIGILPHYPCWSLAALIGVLPEIQGGKPIIALDDNYITYPHMSDLHIKADNLVDACVAMIEKLHGHGSYGYGFRKLYERRVRYGKSRAKSV